MLVIDLVESEVFDDALHVKELHDEYAIVSQGAADAIGNAVEFFEVEENAGSVDHIEFSVQGLSDIQIEKGVERGDVVICGDFGGGFGGFNAQAIKAEGLEILELRAIVGADVENRFGFFVLGESLVYFAGDAAKVFGEGSGDAGEISVISEHGFFGDREVELRGLAIGAPDHAQGVEWFFSDLLGF
jgi:hypothetical protein